MFDLEAKEMHAYLGEVLARGVEHLKNTGEPHSLGAQIQKYLCPMFRQTVVTSTIHC